MAIACATPMDVSYATVVVAAVTTGVFNHMNTVKFIWLNPRCSQHRPDIRGEIGAEMWLFEIFTSLVFCDA